MNIMEDTVADMEMESKMPKESEPCEPFSMDLDEYVNLIEDTVADMESKMPKKSESDDTKHGSRRRPMSVQEPGLV